MAKRTRLVTIFIVIAMIIFGNIGVMAQPPHGNGEQETETFPFEGYCNVGSPVEESLELQRPIGEIEFVLMWEDDEGSNSDPDVLSLMTSDGMHEPKSDSGPNGMLTIIWDEHGLNDTWNMVINCESAGSTTEPMGPFGLLTEEVEDPGNSWTMLVTVTYSSGMGGPPPGVQAILSSPIFKVHIALMVASVFLFLITGLVAGAFLFTRIYSRSPEGFKSLMDRLFNPPFLLIFMVILTFLVFFIAAVPIGMWVAGMFYGWNKAWTGFPAIWNPEAFDMTNADNVSFIVLLLWFIPMYVNRAQIMRSKYYKKLFGWSKFAMKRAEKTPDPIIPNSVLALCYCLLGIMTFVIFEVQPHGSGS
ncbi:MAG: hypothetical protein JSV09_01395 [Thermoplasmata archaeon]|nr:MAG: hypothetical protein JSV09_01395 [Thermoplasmata archaeon]